MPSLKLSNLLRRSTAADLRDRAASLQADLARVVQPTVTGPTAPSRDAAKPSSLAQACDQAIGDWNAIQPRSRAEDWGDEQLDEALDAYGAVFRRAIVEPSRGVDELRAKARLLLHDLKAHDTTGREEAALTDDMRLTRVVLREVAGLSSSTTLTPLAVADRLSAEMLALWPIWAAHTGDDGTDEQTAAYEAMQERRFNLLDAADALPATPENIQPKAIALAWLHYVNEWRRGQKRGDYCIDERLAIDIHMAVLAQSEPQRHAAPRFEPNLVGMLDLASASMGELQSIRDVAERVGSVAYVHAWSPRCRDRVNASGAPHFNAAGKLVQWVGDALTAVETAVDDEARRRTPESQDDRETRLAMLAVTTIDNGDPDETEAFARELLAHAEAERQGR